MQIINLTPHEITVQLPDGELRRYPPSGQVARVEEIVQPHSELDGVPVVACRFGQVQGLPEPHVDVLYIVSPMVAQATTRRDVVAPDTGPSSVVRGADGKITAVRRFRIFA